MKLTIYFGGEKPLKAIGKNQCRILEFAYKYPNWHSFAQDRATKRAVKGLQTKGHLQVVDDQFKIRLTMKG